MKKKAIAMGLAVVMMVSLMPAAFAATIPQDAMRYRGHYYYAYSDVKTWTQAKEACEAVGGHLATITSAEEQQKVTEYLTGLSNCSGYWLGATDQVEEGQWRWITGENWSYENWDEAQPDNYVSADNVSPTGQKDEDYLGVAIGERNWAGNGRWNDFADNHTGSDTALGYLCEWDYASEWAGEELEKAEGYDLIPEMLENADMTQPITRLEFAAVSVKTYENLANTTALPATVNPFVDCNDAEMLKAYNAGIAVGTSDTTFEPDTLLNREQAAAMLTRVFKRATMPGWTIADDAQYPLTYTKPEPFADDANISGWAKDSVYFMAANNIIAGVGDNKFAPVNTTSEEEANRYANATREQALAIAVRMVENLK